MIVVKVRPKNSQQVLLIENDEMIKALVTDGTDQPLNERILPGRSRRSDHFLDAHATETPLEDVAVDTIAITNQESRRLIKWKRFDHPLSRPRGRWVCWDVEVNDATSIVAKQDKGEKYAKRGRWDGEEVDGDDVDQMIVEKGAPSL